MRFHFEVVELPTGRLHLARTGASRTACGRRGQGWQIILDRHMRGALLCSQCVRAVQLAVLRAR